MCIARGSAEREPFGSNNQGVTFALFFLCGNCRSIKSRAKLHGRTRNDGRTDERTDEMTYRAADRRRKKERNKNEKSGKEEKKKEK